jgi:hypothetical protein
MNALQSLRFDLDRYESALMHIAYNCTTQEECERVAKHALNIDVTTSEDQLDLWANEL